MLDKQKRTDQRQQRCVKNEQKAMCVFDGIGKHFMKIKFEKLNGKNKFELA